MPKFTMLVAISGTRNGQDWPGVGGTVDLPEAEGADLVRAGLAVEGVRTVKPGSFNTEPQVETAAAPKPETAARKPGRKSVKAATAKPAAPDTKE